jgi:hypothetical protein
MIKREMLEYMQILDKNKKHLPVGITGELPKGAKEYAIYSVELQETIYKKNKKTKKFDKLIGFNSSWSEDLALAIFNNTEFKLKESIIISARSCERCMNSLAHEYGLSWGYPKYSNDWDRCGTSCLFCKDETLSPKTSICSQAIPIKKDKK